MSQGRNGAGPSLSLSLSFSLEIEMLENENLRRLARRQTKEGGKENVSIKLQCIWWALGAPWREGERGEGREEEGLPSRHFR